MRHEAIQQSFAPEVARLRRPAKTRALVATASRAIIGARYEVNPGAIIPVSR